MSKTTSISSEIIRRNTMAKKLFGKKQIARIDRDFMKQVKGGKDRAKIKYGF